MESLTQSSVFDEIGHQTVHVAEVRGQEPEDLDLHIWQLLSRTALAHPQREAVVSAWQPQQLAHTPPSSSLDGDSCLRWTYKDLLDKSELMASAFWDAGCRPGMRIGAVLWNSAEWALLFWAAARMGATFAPIDPRNTMEARRMLRMIRPDFVVVQDEHSAGIIDNNMLVDRPGLICIQCSGPPGEGWLNLHHLCTDDVAQPRLNHAKGGEKHDLDAAILIVFTSGTSGVPKGCVHKSQNLVSQTNNYDPNEDPTAIDRWLVHTPVSHIFAINNMLRAWRLGDAVVLPSKAFNVNLTVRALINEACTIMSATPTLVRTLIADPSFPGAGAVMLNLVTIAATMVRVDDIRLCQNTLGTKDSVQAYGMSEGAPLLSWARTDNKIRGGFHPGVGRVLPGAAIRICQPGSRKVLARNEVGELHVSGPSVIDGYLDDVNAESFYEESSVRWLMTGDQGMMDSEGIVHLLGRYKDIIVRGGENINPGIIEQVLADLPGVREAHVVGVPDSVAGEMPVAVVKVDPIASKLQLQNEAFELGSKYVLDEVYTFEELGIEDVPVTSLNKVRKQELRQIVLDHRQRRAAHSLISPFTITNGSLAQSLMTVWEDLTGHRPTAMESIGHTADSILLLRYCDAVFRSCGQRMYLQDVVQHDTIEKQVGMLRGRTGHNACKGPDARASDSNVASDLPGHTQEANLLINGSISMPKNTSHAGVNRHNLPVPKRGMSGSAVEKEVSELGLGRSVVEDSVPIRSSLHRTVAGQRPQSYQVRMIFRVHHASIQQIIRGTEKALTVHSMLRTIFFRKQDDVLEHLIIKPDHQLLETLISTRHVESETQAQAHWKNDPIEQCPSNFMFRCEIISVQATGNKYMSMQYNHSIVDALSLWSWHRDLDRLIDDVNADVALQTPYKRYAELFHLYEDSSLAKRAVLFHVKRIRGISRLTQALWPVQRAPGWMISNDERSSFAVERHRIRDQVWSGDWQGRSDLFQYPRLGRVVHVPQIRKLKEHGVEASLFAKCAIFLFNTLQTGSSYAILSTWESGRSWPFVPPWIESTLPPVMSVGGPTAQWILNIVQVFKNESVMDYFQRMAGEFQDVERYQHAPWQKILEELRDEGPLAEDASFRQAFVWDVSLGLASSSGFRDDMRTLEAIARMDWADCGLFWNAFMIDADNLYFIASWDTAQMNDIEVGGYCDVLAEVMRKLAIEENWHRSVASVTARLKSEQEQVRPTHLP